MASPTRPRPEREHNSLGPGLLPPSRFLGHCYPFLNPPRAPQNRRPCPPCPKALWQPQECTLRTSCCREQDHQDPICVPICVLSNSLPRLLGPCLPGPLLAIGKMQR